MEYIHKLPFLFGAAAAIIVGVICNLNSVSQQDTYIRMAIFMIIFFAIGIYARNTILKINDEVNLRKLEEERIKQKEMEEIRKEEERLAHEAEGKKGTSIDLKTDDYGEDFSPLKVSEYMKSE